MEIEFTVRIIPEEKRQQLFSSCLFAAGSLLLSIFLGLYIPILLGLFLGFGCWSSYLCFKPYLKLRAQEKNPDRLAITLQRLIYFTKGKKALSIPLRAIAKVEYKEGLLIYLKKPVSERVEILDPKLLGKGGETDFYFEWFEPKAFALLEQEIKNASLTE